MFAFGRRLLAGRRAANTVRCTALISQSVGVASPARMACGAAQMARDLLARRLTAISSGAHSATATAVANTRTIRRLSTAAGSSNGGSGGGGDDLVPVHYLKQSATFRLPPAPGGDASSPHGAYTIEHLKRDAAKHWKLPVERVILHDGMGNIWPADMSVMQIRSTRESLHVKLARPIVTAAAIAAGAVPDRIASVMQATDAAIASGRAATMRDDELLRQPNDLQHTLSFAPRTLPPSPSAAAGATAAAPSTALPVFDDAKANAAEEDLEDVDDSLQGTATPTAGSGGGSGAEDDTGAGAAGDDAYDGSASSAAGGTDSVALTVLHRRFRLRLKYLLRTQTARKLLADAYAIDRKTQGAHLNDFVDRIELSGTGPRAISRELIHTILTQTGTTESIVIHTVVPLFAQFVNQELSSHGGRALDESVAWAANLTLPHEWYPLARQLKRKIVVHVGPTNSGKTYHALKRLRESSSGVYCGPLRLLAWEVHEKLLAQGCQCSLLTGQEQTIIDVAVIDEMQMIGSLQRGDVWTRAFLGVPAREVHVCGDPSMVPLIEELCSLTGEKYEIRTYKRLTPLKLSSALRTFDKIQKGDCVIGFGRKDLYSLKKQIEQATRLKCCLIYGSLPPETRRQQAELFNDPQSGYDVLVATDAVGMGLNLNIRRVVFSTLWKFDGDQRRRLHVPEALQIGGRAGRFGTEHAGVGFVTTLKKDDEQHLRTLFRTALEPLTRAGLSPSVDQIQQLHYHRPDAPLSSLLSYMNEYATIDPIYYLADKKDQIRIAAHIERLPMSLHDRFLFSMAPVKADNAKLMQALLHYAETFVTTDSVELNCTVPGANDVPRNAHGIENLESSYLHLDLYVWLARRYGDSVFVDREKAINARTHVAGLIDRGLESISPYYNEPNLAQKAKRRIRRSDEKENELRARAIQASVGTHAGADFDDDSTK